MEVELWGEQEVGSGAGEDEGRPRGGQEGEDADGATDQGRTGQ